MEAFQGRAGVVIAAEKETNDLKDKSRVSVGHFDIKFRRILLSIPNQNGSINLEYLAGRLLDLLIKQPRKFLFICRWIHSSSNILRMMANVNRVC